MFIKRWGARLGLLALGALMAVIGLYILRSLAMPELDYWHSADSVEAMQPLALDNIDSLDDYLRAEQAMFQRLQTLIGQRSDETSPSWSRYNAASYSYSGNHSRDWNRSFVLSPERQRGVALLSHGLSDSPYSMRAVGEHLQGQGFTVLGLRVPGHGTVPAHLAVTRWRDFQKAYQLAVVAMAAKRRPGEPLILVGYSNGAALAVDYASRALEDDSLPRADGLILISPAVQVSAAAAFARLQLAMAQLPGLDKLGWTDIVAEYDPYKYNTFPVYAGEQIYRLTSQLQKRLQRQSEQGLLQGFPPLLVFHSLADATIAPQTVHDGLLRYLPAAAAAELVMFDVNRNADVKSLLIPAKLQFVERLKAEADNYRLTLIENRDDQQFALRANTRLSTSDDWQQQALSLRWPRGVYSLSHVALPFPADDPLYGSQQSLLDFAPLLDSSMVKLGERGLLAIPVAQFNRLRYNPFFDYLLQRVDEFNAATLSD